MKDKLHYAKQLTIRYQQLNECWRKYDPVITYDLAQDVNFHFSIDARLLTDLVLVEIEKVFSKPGITPEKLAVLLRKLSEAIAANIDLYGAKEPILSTMDFEQLAVEYGETDARVAMNNYKTIYERSQTLKSIIDEFTSVATDNQDTKLATNVLPLESIFAKSEYYKKCIDLLVEYEAFELSPRKGYILFAIIDAIKEKETTLLKKKSHGTWTDAELLSLFNYHTRNSFAQMKRNSAPNTGFATVKAQVRQALTGL